MKSKPTEKPAMEKCDERPGAITQERSMALPSPITDRAWELFNEKRCGLHYVAQKMREIEIERGTLLGAITKTLEENAHLADGENCTLIDIKRAAARVGCKS